MARKVRVNWTLDIEEFNHIEKKSNKAGISKSQLIEHWSREDRKNSKEYYETKARHHAKKLAEYQEKIASFEQQKIERIAEIERITKNKKKDYNTGWW